MPVDTGTVHTQQEYKAKQCSKREVQLPSVNTSSSDDGYPLQSDFQMSKIFVARN